jgi:PAS domain S-box-containing protein
VSAGGQVAELHRLHAADGTPCGSLVAAEVLERLPAAVALLDAGWTVRYVNQRAERLMGLPRDEVLGRSLWSAVPVLAGTPVEEGFRSAAELGRRARFDAVLPGIPGRWWEITAWPARDGLAVHLVEISARRAAEEAARRASARTALLAQLATELSGALDGEAALGVLAQLVVPTLADACIVTVVDRDGRPRDVGSWHTDPDRRELLEQYTGIRLDWLPPDSPVARALQLGTPVTEPIATLLARMEPGHPSADVLRRLGTGSVVVLPLPAEARTVGVLTLYQDPGRVMTEADLRTAAEVAAQAGRAVERVHRHSQQAQLAEALQRSLLTEPPRLPGVEVAVRYVPAAEAARVGGDWYDAFALADGTPVIVIGDVTGHDTAAAAAMGQLRGLLRGVAHAGGGGPAEVLRAFDAAVVDLHPDTLATAALARIERDGGGRTRLRWASAGHPPPALVRGRDGVELLGGTSGELLLGVDPSVRRTESTVTLEPGDTVLLYTDGLVERRDATFDVGLRRLEAALAELVDLPLEELCDALLARMLPATPRDDVALVMLRLDGGRARPGTSEKRPPPGSEGSRHGDSSRRRLDIKSPTVEQTATEGDGA